jgi:class 3 adenylate cyclase
MAAGEQIPETLFTQVGDDRIAYQVFGQGDVDLVDVQTMADCIDMRWLWPPYASFLRRLATHARIIMFDRRGTGASDAPSGEALPSWERLADDIRAVLDEVGSEKAVLYGQVEAGHAILFAASHPTRTQGLILANTSARFRAAPDYPGMTLPVEEIAQVIEQGWGTGVTGKWAHPDSVRDPAFRHWSAMTERLTLSPRDAGKFARFAQSLDVRDALTSVRVSTLVLHRQGSKLITPEHGRYLAEHIAGAHFVLLPGNDLALYADPATEGLRHIEEFLGRLHGVTETDRALAAILYTDIVGSTERVSAMGDRQWRDLLDTHDAVARTMVEQYRGRIVKTTGDGLLATFDGPGRAIRCALALGDALRPLGLEIRSGLHTGEVELRGTDIAGIGAHIAARVLEAAQPGELLVSAAVPMLVAGSGFEFEDRGEHELKGVSGTWKLFAVAR